MLAEQLIPGLDFGFVDLGASGLLVLVVLLILTGKLVPISVVRDVRSERDAYREIAMRAIAHTGDLLPSAKLAVDLVESIQKAAEPTEGPQ